MKTIIDGQEIEYEIGSGNIFADLGVKNPEEALLKSRVVGEIQRIVESRNLTSSEAAKIVGLTPSKLNDVLRGRLSGYSMERLLRMVNALGHDVEVKISKRRRANVPGVFKIKAA